MKVDAVIGLLSAIVKPIADAIARRRAKKVARDAVQEALQGFGDEGGHPQPYPLEEARRRARERRGGR